MGLTQRLPLLLAVLVGVTACETDPPQTGPGEPTVGTEPSTLPDPHRPMIAADTPPAPASAPAPTPDPAPVARGGPRADALVGGDDEDDAFVYAELREPATRRAFYTAPPVIPHGLGTTDRECLACHTKRKSFQGETTTLTPHPHLSNCMQCHVRGRSPAFVKVVGNAMSSWQGLEPPGKGTRQFIGAPPTISHRIFLRENCRSCHHTLLKEPHYTSMFQKKEQCQQCHVMMHPKLEF